MNRLALRTALIRDEGIRLKPYVDTVGKLTIGVGRNLTDRGLSPNEVQILLDNDLDIVEKEVRKAIPWYVDLDEPRQEVLLNMAFNLGTPTLLTFKRFLVAAERGDHLTASEMMLDSKWARQVKGRALRLAAQWRTGIRQ